jgi:hypothetical protein
MSDASNLAAQTSATAGGEVESIALPAPLSSLVQQVARLTRLWRAERADVVRELSAHFQDGLTQGQSPDDLARCFGEPRVAAKLIRRSKRRNRPWWWQAWHRSLQGFGVFFLALLAIYLALAVRFFTGKPGPIHDYLADLNAPALAVPAGLRAWPLYRDALLALPDLKGDDSPARAATRPGEPRWAELEEFLIEHQDSIAQLRLAASRPALGYPVGYDIAPADRELWPDMEPGSEARFGLVGVLLPHLGDLRQLARLLGSDARRAAAAGDGETALANLVAIIGVARHCRETSSVISGLASLAVHSVMHQAAEDILAAHPDLWSDAQLQMLAHQLAGVRDDELRVDFLGERYYFLDFIQRVYTDDGDGDGRLAPIGLGQMAALTTVSRPTPPKDSLGVVDLAGPVAMALAAGRRDMLERHEEYMNLLESEAAKPLWLQRLERADEEMQRLNSQPVERLRYLPLALLLPALSKAARSGEYAMAKRDVLLTVIALELHRRRHGSWPQSLEELVPALLPAIPPDRFDGRPLHYALVDGKPLLYSIGNDRDDDGGRLAQGHGPPTHANEDAKKWRPIEQVAASPALPVGRRVADGDWILWPPVIDPPDSIHGPNQ